MQTDSSAEREQQFRIQSKVTLQLAAGNYLQYKILFLLNCSVSLLSK